MIGFLVIVIVLLILALIAVDYAAGAIGGDARLWLLLKALLVIMAIVAVLDRMGVLRVDW